MTGETRYKMDWPAVIEHNRLILLRIVARLFALAGLALKTRHTGDNT